MSKIKIPIMQDICSIKRYMGNTHINRLTEEWILTNIGFKNHPIYTPTKGSF